jgi:hypothetical protein
MKNLFLATFVLFTLNTFSQKHLTFYIEIRGNVDALGNIYLDNIIRPQKISKVDSMVDYAKIKTILNLREPIKIINKLSENGWALVSVTQVLSDKENRPSSAFILYYFKRDFEL